MAEADQVSSRTPQPVSALARPASVYITVSRSGDTSSPWSSRSSPVLTTIDRSSAMPPVRSRASEARARPWLSFAPPEPPAGPPGDAPRRRDGAVGRLRGAAYPDPLVAVLAHEAEARVAQEVRGPA